MSALVGRDPVCDLFYMECYMEWTRRKTEQMAGFVSHPNTQRLNLWSARFNIWKSIKVTDPIYMQPVNPKGNQPWLFIGRNEAEAPILWPPEAKGQLIGKDPDAR